MRYTALLPLVATASAFVVPNADTIKALVLDQEHNVEDVVSSWWDAVPKADDLRTSVSDILNGAADTLERQASRLKDYVPDVDFEFDLFGDCDDDDDDDEEYDFGDYDFGEDEDEGEGEDDDDDDDDDEDDGGRHGGHGRHGRRPRTSNYTIYGAIKYSKYTTKLAKLVDEFPDIVEALNSTAANFTLFAPLDRAFDKIPDHHKKPSREFLEKLLSYHVLPGNYPAGRILAGHTFPTLAKEDWLGGRPQRLRVHLGLYGLRINFYSKISYPNMFFKNGIIHGIESILVPPPSVDKIVALLPGEFSTLSLAAEKTGLTRPKEEKTTGTTVFAPTNGAFRRLGPAANAFLFNTEKGLKYLKALLYYHIVLNETLYSDAFYGLQGDSKDTVTDQENGHFHADLPTLLGDRRLSIDIARWYGLIEMKINGFTRVAVQDGIGKDGVLQVIESVLIPPHEQRGQHAPDAQISVEDLVERLEPYVNGEDTLPSNAGDSLGDL